MYVIPNSTTVHVYRWLIKPFMIMLLESLLGKTHRIIIISVTIQVPNAHFMMEVPHPEHCSDSLAYIVQVSTSDAGFHQNDENEPKTFNVA